MADEVVTEEVKEEVKPAAPVIDAEAIGRRAAESASQAVRDILGRQAEPAPAVDALEEVVAPYVDKRVGRGILIAQMAADKADFYSVDDPEELALRQNLREEVEKRALALANNGRAMPRQDIYNHLKGEKETEVSEFRQKGRKIREDRARNEAGDEGGMGGGPRGSGMPRHVSVDQAHDLQGTGKLDEFLGDKSF